MKLQMWVWLIVLALIVAAGLKWFGQFLNEIENENRNDIDDWVDDNVALALSRKINRSVEEISKILQGTMKSDLTTLINQTVHTISLTFTRLPENRDIEIRLDIIYEDSTSFVTTTQRNWDALPESIRSEFLRGGGRIAQRPCEFPGIYPT